MWRNFKYFVKILLKFTTVCFCHCKYQKCICPPEDWFVHEVWQGGMEQTELSQMNHMGYGDKMELF